MSDIPEISQKALERLLRPLEDGRVEVVVTYRRHEDYDAYERELASLREQVERLQRDIYTWTNMGNQYLATLDELRRLQRILRKHQIDY